MNTHADLIRISDAIGGIAGSACWYTQRLAERITRTHGIIDITTLPVGELIRIDAELREDVMRDHARSLL